MREQIRKPIKNEDLYEGCREAFKAGWQHVKLYFLCGLPGERHVDLDGIVDMAETIARIGKEVTGRYADVTAIVSNFVPKPHTPYQWNGMQTREYFHWAGDYLHRQKRITLGEGQAARHRDEPARRHPDARRPPRRAGAGRGLAARCPARRLARVLQAGALVADVRATWASTSPSTRTRQRPMTEVLPWDHVNVKKGREYLEKEQKRSVMQLRVMADAVSGEGDKEPGGCGG